MNSGFCKIANCVLLGRMLTGAWGLAAAPLPAIGPNARLGDDPTELPISRRAQAEPHLARSPLDPNLLIATFQEGRFEDGGAVDCGYAVSRDGGQTWTRALIPTITTLVGGRFDRASDPVAGADLLGNIFLNTLAVTGTPDNFFSAVLLSVSSNNAASFPAPTLVEESLDTRRFLDKNWMAVNTFAGTPTANRVAVAYTRPPGRNLDIGFIAQPVALTFSDDAGRTWSAPREISSPSAIGAQPVFLRDGSLASINWSHINEAGTSFDRRIEFTFSADGGATFTAPRTVTRVTTHDDPVARDGYTLPSLATDRLTGTLYLAFQTRRGTRPEIQFTRSTDRGQTWTEPVAANDTPLNRSVFNPALAVSPDGQHVTIVFYDKRHDTTGGNLVDLYLAESFDGGETWPANVRVSEVSSDLRRAPLTPLGRMLGDYHGNVAAVDLDTPGVACWIDTRTGSPDPFAARLTRAQGASFATWRRLRFGATDLANLAISGPSGDPDGDGQSNFAEYALALDPRQPKPAPLIVTSVDAREITFTYNRLRTASDAAFQWEISGDLSTWSALAPARENVEKLREPLLEAVHATFSRKEEQRFFRLRIAPR